MPYRKKLSDSSHIYVNSEIRAGHYLPVIEQIRNNLKHQLQSAEIPMNFYINILSDITLWSKLAANMDSALLSEKNIAQLGHAFENNIATAINRSFLNIEKLQQHFDTDKPIHLAKITESNGDPHKGGQRVLFLHFSDSKDDRNTYNIVYKPTVINIDDFLVGKHEMKDENPSSSITELLNLHLQQLGKPELPTYRFIIGDSSIENGYGFIEHLPHQPWPRTNLQRECYRLIEDFSRELKGDQTDYGKFPAFLQDQLKYAHKDLYQSYPYYKQLIDVVKDLQSYLQVQFECELMDSYRYHQKWQRQSDFVITDEETYSFERGCNLALAYIFRIADLHMENAIISQQHFVLTDLECAFQPTCETIMDTFLLRSKGAMNYNNSDITLWIKPDENNHGYHSVDILRPSQNRAFKITNQNDGLGVRLNSCLINESTFLDGFKCIWNIIRENRNIFLDVLQKHRSTSIRIVPYPTEDWPLFINESVRNNRMQTDEKIWQALRDKPPKHIVLNQSASLQALENGDIPIFYCALNEKNLRDEHYQCIANDYHIKSPLECVSARIANLAPSPETLLEEIHTSIATINTQINSAPSLLARLKPPSPPSSIHTSELGSNGHSPFQEDKKSAHSDQHTAVSSASSSEGDWDAEIAKEEAEKASSISPRHRI